MKRLLIIILLTLSFSTLGASLIGEVNEFSVDKTIKELTEENASKPKDEPLIIALDSAGGSVFYGFKLINEIILLQLEGRKIHTVVTGMCASMCFTVLQAGDVRVSYRLAILMQHHVSGGSPFARKILERAMRVFESNRMGINLYEWIEKASPEVWFAPLDALKYGAIDIVIGLEK